MIDDYWRRNRQIIIFQAYVRINIFKQNGVLKIPFLAGNFVETQILCSHVFFRIFFNDSNEKINSLDKNSFILKRFSGRPLRFSGKLMSITF